MGMSSRAVWREGLSFTGFTGSGFEVPMGASVADGGVNDGPRPMEMLLVGLSGCTGMDVVSILRNKKQKISGFEVLVDSDRATTYPMIFTKIRVKYVITGQNIDRSVVEYAIKQSSDKYCSAEAMLAEVAPVEHTYEIIETAVAAA